MPRVTEEERVRFHRILDLAIDKMNRPKNAKKDHWHDVPIKALQKSAAVESSELDLAVSCYHEDQIIEECKDLINYPMMIIDKIQNTKNLDQSKTKKLMVLICPECKTKSIPIFTHIGMYQKVDSFESIPARCINCGHIVQEGMSYDAENERWELNGKSMDQC